MLKHFIFALAIGINLFAHDAHGEIIETADIASALQYVDQDSIVFFNVTGTLYEPSSTLAEYRWRNYFSEYTKELIRNPNVSKIVINQVKNDIVQKIPKKVVEEITTQLVQDLQQRKIPVFGITRKHRRTDFSDSFDLITSRNIQSLGIYLEKTLTYFRVKKSHAYAFAYGILFKNEKSTGDALLSFLMLNLSSHNKIVIVDNTLSNLEKAEKALSSTPYTFIGLRHSKADCRKEHFNPLLGIIEFLAFQEDGTLLSDEQAAKVLENSDRDFLAHFDAQIYKLANEAILKNKL